MQVIQKTPAERLVHALTFELVAMLICAPLFSWLMDLPLAEMGVMTLMFAAVAMVWNMVFN
ncbi:MAG: hypothetical protein I4O48_16620, partial [Ralstonia sp.]|nr:hypothetical protein [Ralstonia sp.]MDF6705711.1 Na(+)-translocating NADH-quinone reductase subunit E [Escherichia coli]